MNVMNFGTDSEQKQTINLQQILMDAAFLQESATAATAKVFHSSGVARSGLAKARERFLNAK